MELTGTMKQYKMDKESNGYVLLLSDKNNEDMNQLEKTFKRNNFITKLENNLTKTTINNFVELGICDFIKCPCNTFIIVINGSITQNGFLLATDKEFSLNSFQNMLIKREELSGIPKIFIIQTTRGDRIDIGQVSEDSVYTYDENVKFYTIPENSDFLVLYSSSAGFKSHEEVNFIKTLDEELNEYISSTDLLSIFSSVSRRIALTEYKSGIKQMPIIHSRLTAMLHFKPPYIIDKHVLEIPRYNIENKKISVIMFNHLEFSKDYQKDKILASRNLTRRCTNDMVNLEKTFIGMDYNVNLHKDLSRRKVLDKIKKLLKEDIDGMILVFSTHGLQHKLLAYDKMIDINNDLLPLFKGKLIGKPKIFFINACRGHEKGKGVANFFKESIDLNETVCAFEESEAISIDDSNLIEDNLEHLPETADFLLSYSTIDGYVSYIDQSIFYLSKLNDVLQGNQNKDLLWLLTNVQGRVAREDETSSSENPDFDNKKQMPCFDSSLTRKFYFPNK